MEHISSSDPEYVFKMFMYHKIDKNWPYINFVNNSSDPKVPGGKYGGLANQVYVGEKLISVTYIDGIRTMFKNEKLDSFYISPFTYYVIDDVIIATCDNQTFAHVATISELIKQTNLLVKAVPETVSSDVQREESTAIVNLKNLHKLHGGVFMNLKSSQEEIDKEVLQFLSAYYRTKFDDFDTYERDHDIDCVVLGKTMTIEKFLTTYTKQVDVEKLVIACGDCYRTKTSFDINIALTCLERHPKLISLFMASGMSGGDSFKQFILREVANAEARGDSTSRSRLYRLYVNAT